jgi:hypothetical protein
MAGMMCLPSPCRMPAEVAWSADVSCSGSYNQSSLLQLVLFQ